MENQESGPANTAFEDKIKSMLHGAAQAHALQFARYAEANNMVYGEHGDIRYRDTCICYTHVDGLQQMPGPWTIWTEGDYDALCDDIPMDQEMLAVAWEHVNHCGNCGSGCNPGKRRTILGRTFDDVCSAVMAFTDPDAKALACVTKLLDMRKREIDAQVSGRAQ